ncbi:RmlC-like cupin domain-containing protein [Linnemannia elongata]|nr:RmlC-like cupin domain-containing protein [Linnemannia elongata]
MFDEFSVYKNGVFPDNPHPDSKLSSTCSKARRSKRIPPAGTEEEVIVKVIVGESHRLESQICNHTPIMYLDFKMSSNQTITLTFPETYKRFIYILNGTAYISALVYETEAKVRHTLHLSTDGTGTVRIMTKGEEANLVVNAGDLLKELVVQIGPFVKNTREDVYETYQYYSDVMDGFE